MESDTPVKPLDILYTKFVRIDYVVDARGDYWTRIANGRKERYERLEAIEKIMALRMIKVNGSTGE
jgi:hypothetical protein